MITLLFFLASWIVPSQCLEVTNTSLCAKTCDGPSLTYSTDLSCNDDAYWNTANGVTFRNCLECESTSSAESGDTSTPQNNDIYWLLCENVNMKYTLQYCMFQGNGSTPNLPQCEADCAGLYAVLQTSWFSPDPAEQYAYCSINDTAFPTYADGCATCLQSYDGSVVLGNFLDTMQSACDSQPDASLGQTVPLKRELFETATVGTSTTSSSSTSSIGSTSSTASTSLASTSASSSESTTQATTVSSTSSATAPPLQQSSQSSSSGLSSGAAAGVGIACGLGAIALTIGLGWYILKRRRRSRTQPLASSQGSDFPYRDSKLALVNVSPAPPYAQQLASRELHEMDSRQSRSFTTELDGRPVH